MIEVEQFAKTGDVQRFRGLQETLVKQAKELTSLDLRYIQFTSTGIRIMR